MLKKKIGHRKLSGMVMAEVLTAMTLFSIASFGLFFALQTLVENQHQGSRNEAWRALKNWSAQTRFEQNYKDAELQVEALTLTRTVRPYSLSNTVSLYYEAFTPSGYKLLDWTDVVYTEK